MEKYLFDKTVNIQLCFNSKQCDTILIRRIIVRDDPNYVRGKDGDFKLLFMYNTPLSLGELMEIDIDRESIKSSISDIMLDFGFSQKALNDFRSQPMVNTIYCSIIVGSTFVEEVNDYYRWVVNSASI